MSNGTNWYSWLSVPLFAPLSGSVTQDIGAGAYQGSPEIEAAVVRDAASFGTQLGALIDAVLELARRVDPAEAVAPGGPPPEPEAIAKLRALAADIDRVKEERKAAAERDARRALERLGKAVDAARYDAVVRSAKPPA